MGTSKKTMDRARDFITDFLNKYKGGRKYVQLTIHKFLYLELVVTQVDRDTKAKLFVRGAEQNDYWLDPVERRPLVVKMLKAGMKQTVIAKCLKLSASTIYKDVATLRAETDLLDEVPQRKRKTKAPVLRQQLRRAMSSVPAGITLQ